MDRCKYFLDNKLNSVTGWANERSIVPRKKKRLVSIEIKEEENE
jgi:hypothetical protein